MFILKQEELCLSEKMLEHRVKTVKYITIILYINKPLIFTRISASINGLLIILGPGLFQYLSINGQGHSSGLWIYV